MHPKGHNVGTEITGSNSSNVNFDYDDSASLSLSAEGGFSAKVTSQNGYGIGFSVDGSVQATHEVETADGRTTYTANGEASITIKGEVNTPQAGLEIARTDGIVLNFEVSMPTEAATPAAMASATFTDPSTMPVDTVIKVDDSQYQTNEFSATFQNIRASTSVTESEGSSMVVEKTGEDTVRVTIGPTAGIDAFMGVGVDLGPVSVSIGKNTSLDTATFQTAEFDLSTPEGQAAYNHFLTTGEMPTQNGTGVADVQTIEKVDYSSQTDISGSVFGADFTLDGEVNVGSSVIITLPDGTSTKTTDLSYGDNDPLTITQSFDAQGNEIVSERTYAIEVEVTESNYQLINVAYSGNLQKAEDGAVQPGQTATLTFTESEMMGMQQTTHQVTQDDPHALSSSGLVVNTSDSTQFSTLDFAVAIAKTNGSFDEAGFGDFLIKLSGHADGDYSNDDFDKVPFEITIQE